MAVIYKGHIKRELQSIIMLTSIVSLLLACTGFVAYDFITFRHFMVRDLTTLADMLAANIQAAVVFDDRQSAEDTLGTLRSRSAIMSAAVYKVPNDLFADYARSDQTPYFPSKPEWNSHHFEDGRLVLFRPVQFENKPIAVLFLQSDLQPLYARYQTYITIALLLLAVSTLVALALSVRLQHGISQPIQELAETAKIVSSEGDFSVRTKKYSDNEVGLLAEAFNQMLSHIQQRDFALRHSNESLAKLNEQLEERVKHRTDALQESTEQMRVFAYSVAHDLRAPLRSLIGLAQALTEDFGKNLNEAGQDYLRRIMGSAQHMDALIQDLLSYSQIGREELKFEFVDLNATIDAVLNNAADDIKVSGAEVSVDRPLPAVIGHSSTLENVIGNLLSNGIKYIARDVRPSIRIYSEPVGRMIRLWVSDNGIGIAPEFHEKIFGVFTRLHRQEAYPGTGIGLAYVRKAVERMGGSVGLQSQVGEGSRFWIELPAAAPH